jgi:hypothetical protein
MAALVAESKSDSGCCFGWYKRQSNVVSSFMDGRVKEYSGLGRHIIEASRYLAFVSDGNKSKKS